MYKASWWGSRAWGFLHQKSSTTGLDTMCGPFRVGCALLERAAHWVSSVPFLTTRVLPMPWGTSLPLGPVEYYQAFRVEPVTCFNEGNTLEVVLRVKKWPCRFWRPSWAQSSVKAGSECSHTSGLTWHHLEKWTTQLSPAQIPKPLNP